MWRRASMLNSSVPVRTGSASTARRAEETISSVSSAVAGMSAASSLPADKAAINANRIKLLAACVPPRVNSADRGPP